MPGDEECNVERTCLACGYNLFGLGDEPRCPECGLLNIPSAYRQQVWDLVDSGRWFFSGFFNPFAKRPPGWWWALDHEGDLKRARRAARRNFLLAMAIILLSFMIADAIVIQITVKNSVYSTSGETKKLVWERSAQHVIRLALIVRATPLFYPQLPLQYLSHHRWTMPGEKLVMSQTSQLLITPSLGGVKIAAGVLLWLTISWVGPAMVGIWTQIRRGLPEFARPPHTIRAAAYYESHRLVYLSLLIAFCLLIDLIMRIRELPVSHVALCATTHIVMIAAVGTFAATCWIGPLRSDYTKQLVRSRFHAGRIIIRYAILLPLATTFTVGLLINVLMNI